METTLNETEQKFCLIYASGPAPYNGNEIRCYQLVFNDNTVAPTGKLEVEIAIKAHDLLERPDIKDYIEKIRALKIVNATTLRPRLTETLLKISDECSTATFRDKWGTELSPAALRAVSVNAIKTLADIYGIKEDVAHTISVEGADGEGITFNLIAPQPAPKPEEELIG